MNKPLRRVAIFCGLLILALLLRDNWVQFVRADELTSHPKNTRVRIERYANERGNIVVDGKPITGSVDSKDEYYKYKRTYTDGPMWAPVTGYASQAYDANQIEKIEDGILTGNDDRLFFDRTLSMFTGEKKRGGDVVTTLNGAAQKAAFEGLGDNTGAVVAIEPSTGKILALASTPRTTPPPSPTTRRRTRRPGSRWRTTRASRSRTAPSARSTRPAPSSRSSPPPRRWRTARSPTSTRRPRPPRAGRSRSPRCR